MRVLITVSLALKQALLFFVILLLLAACSGQSRTIADNDTAAVSDAEVIKDEKDIGDIKDEMADEDIAVTDEAGDEMLTDSDTPVLCADVALNACAGTQGCVLSELSIISGYGSCYTEKMPVACMAESEKICPSPQWADPEYVYDPATGRCFLLVEGCFPASWEYQVGARPVQCAGGVEPASVPPCGNACHGLLPAQCSQTAGCVALRSQRLRWGKIYDNRGGCIEDREWVGCFANSELSCRDSAYYPVIDLNGKCWISDGCEPLWWQYPSVGHRCSLEGPGDWDTIGSCGSRFCDDGSQVNCQMGMPACEPPATIPALQKGCWKCVEPVSCVPPEDDHCDSPNNCGVNADCPLGYSCTAMLSCNNTEWSACEQHQCWTQREEALTCKAMKPDCGGGVPIINDGCWVCVNATGCLPKIY